MSRRIRAAAVVNRLVKLRAAASLGSLLAMAPLGCQGPLSSGIRAFEESRFVDAAGDLRRAGGSVLAPEERVRWALYLGLAELSLGNLQRALPPLCDARNGLQRAPNALSASERGQLESAWRALGKMPSEPLTRSHQCHAPL